MLRYAMPDDSDPQRKFYQLKPKEFERVNRVPGDANSHATPSPDQGPSAGAAPDQRIDVNDLIRQGAAGVPLLGSNKPANRANDVHGVLRDEYEKAKAAGLFHVTPADDKARRTRIRNYWIAIILWNAPFAWIAWAVNPTKNLGPASAIIFVCAIAAMVLPTSYLTWQTFFLRTER